MLLKAQKNSLNQTAQGAVDAAQNVRKLVEEYKNIKTASDNTEEAKNRLKSIQDTLIETYDVEAEKLDLVNGKYENQLSILENIANQKTETARLAVNAAYYADVDAQKKAFKIDNFTLGTNEVTSNALSEALLSISKKYGSSFDLIKGEFKAGTSYETVEKILQEVLNENQELFEEYINGRFSEEREASGVSEAVSVLAEAMSQAGTAATRFAEITEKYNAYNSGEGDLSDYHWGESIAAEEKRKAEARNAAYQANKEKIQQEQADNAEMYKKLRADAKYSYDMGVIDANAYYTQLAVLRDKYLEPDGEEWRSVNVEIKKYFDSLSDEQKKAYESQLEEQKKAAEQSAAARKYAYAEDKSQLEFKLRTNQISEKKYYSELAKIRDKYLDKNSAEWRSAYLETYEYNQKILQANKDALEQLLNDTSDSTLSALNKIVSARDSLTAKLTDFNKTFEKVTETVPETVAVAGKFTITTAEHDEETYKMGADSIEDNIRILEEYGDMLEALKARGADESTLDSILGMDIEEGMEFGTRLLKMSDREWKSYFDSLDRLHKTAADISAKYYQDQVNALKENFVDKLRQELDGLGTDMYKVGADVAAEFVKGWNESLGTKDLTLGEIMRAVSGGTLSTAPTAAQGMTAAGTSSLGGVTKMMSKILKIPVYIGTSKLEEITVDALNGRIIQTGKNVLLT